MPSDLLMTAQFSPRSAATCAGAKKGESERATLTRVIYDKGRAAPDL